jgi:hypothetical protein
MVLPLYLLFAAPEFYSSPLVETGAGYFVLRVAIDRPMAPGHGHGVATTLVVHRVVLGLRQLDAPVDVVPAGQRAQHLVVAILDNRSVAIVAAWCLLHDDPPIRGTVLYGLAGGGLAAVGGSDSVATGRRSSMAAGGFFFRRRRCLLGRRAFVRRLQHGLQRDAVRLLGRIATNKAFVDLRVMNHAIRRVPMRILACALAAVRTKNLSGRINRCLRSSALRLRVCRRLM